MAELQGFKVERKVTGTGTGVMRKKQLAVFLAIVLIGAIGFSFVPVSNVSVAINPSGSYLSISTDIVLASTPATEDVARTETLPVSRLPPTEPIVQSYSPDNITLQVGASTDDCLRRLGTPYWGLTDANIIIGSQTAAADKVGGGMRFTNVTIPQGATITTAYLTVRAQVSKAGIVINSNISAEDVDNATTFADNATTFDARWANRTTARMSWDNISAWTLNTNYTSPTTDGVTTFASVIQEVVDRDGWTSGNSIVIFWEDFEDRSDATAHRNILSYDGNSTYAPKLHIEYEEAVNITNTPASYAFGNVGASATPVTGLTAFNVTNTGDVAVNISIKGTNMSGSINNSITQLNDTFAEGQEDRVAVWYPTTPCVYTFGGQKSDSSTVADILKWVSGSNVTDTGVDLDSTVRGSAAVYDANMGLAYIYGGEILGTDAEHNCTNKTFWFNPSDNSTGTCNETLVAEMMFSSAVYHPTKEITYIFGGLDYNESYQNKTWVHNATAETITEVSGQYFPTAIAIMTATYVSDNDCIYLFGGYIDGYGSVDYIHKFDCVNETISKLNVTCPYEMEGAACYYNTVDDLVYVFGGCDRYISVTGYHDDIWTFDPSDDTTIETLNLTLLNAQDDFYGIYDSVNHKGYLIGTQPSGAGVNDIANQKYICEVNTSVDTPWVLNDTATAGTDIYGLKAGLDGGDYTITVNLTGGSLCNNLSVNATQGWGLKLYTPTSFSDYNEKTGTVTLTATEA